MTREDVEDILDSACFTIDTFYRKDRLSKDPLFDEEEIDDLCDNITKIMDWVKEGRKWTT